MIPRITQIRPTVTVKRVGEAHDDDTNETEIDTIVLVTTATSQEGSLPLQCFT